MEGVDLNSSPSPADRGGRWSARAMLALLTFDGVLSALAGALFAPLYLGSVPFPISAIISGAVNAAMAWAALQCTESARAAAAPMWAFLLTVLVLSVGGPGGDVVFGGPGVLAAARPLIFVVVGVAPAAAVLRARRPRPS